ncbi:MAG: ATP-binding protein [Plesiomonas sp.]|uniref:ATP-binding protein n=3 Tax=Plesiomonas sp. TaxID=2486279 RepID=UPI003F2C4660
MWATESLFTPEETLWIKQHRKQTIYIPVNVSHELSYHRYLISLLEKKTGLKFMVSSLYTGQLNPQNIVEDKDLPAVIFGADYRYSQVSSVTDQYQFIHPFMYLRHEFISLGKHQFVGTLDHLKTEKVAVIENSYLYHNLTRQPKSLAAVLVPALSINDIFDKLRSGEADVGIVVGAEFDAVQDDNKDIYLGGYVNLPPKPFSVMVSKNNKELYQVLSKALSSITAKEMDQSLMTWKESTEQTKPTLHQLWVSYRWQILATLIMICSLSISLLCYMYAYRAKKQSERIKSRFLAMISHEVKTPIGVMLSVFELLRGTKVNQSQREMINQADDAGQLLLSLLNNLLDMSRLDARKLNIDLRPVKLIPILAELERQYSIISERKKITLNVHEHNIADYNCFNIDELRVKQILYNLISNALKFTAQGEVTLSARFCNQKGQDNGILEFDVSDTGIGIAEQDKTKLFLPFSQVDNSTSRVFGGTGLGLSICKELVELMGGTISLESQKGRGSRFIVRIPTTACKVEEPRTQSNKPLVTTHDDPVILLVDDHEANRFVIGQQLKQLGYRFITACNGHEALALLDAGTDISLILLDCYMPELDGFEVAQRIRRNEIARDLPMTPIIAISADSGEEHYARCLDSGMDGISTKPLSLKQLKALLELWIDTAEPFESTLSDINSDKPDIHESDLSGEGKLLARFIELSQQDIADGLVQIDTQHYSGAANSFHRILGGANILELDAVAVLAKRLEHALRGELYLDDREVIKLKGDIAELAYQLEKLTD